MKLTSWADRVSGITSRMGAWIGAAAAFLLVIVVVANIITRLLGGGIPGVLDISQSFMVIIAAMMLAYTQAQRGHIGVEFIIKKMPERVQQVVGIITLLLSFTFAILLAWQSWRMAWFALKVGDHSGVYPYLPFYPAKLILTLGVTLLCIQLLIDVWHGFQGLFSSSYERN